VRAFNSVGGHPIFIARAGGSRLLDVDGNEYLDFCLSWGPLILGHAHHAVVEAVESAARRGLSYGACHPGEVELAEAILRGLPHFNKVRLVNSGTEAVMTALRLARAVTGRDLIIKCEGGYHGHSDGLLVKAGSGLATHGATTSAGIPAEVAQATVVAGFDDEAGMDEVFRRYGERIAAVIIEPLPANNGLLVQRREFLEHLRRLTHEGGALLVFDEVISGFRLCYGGYYRQLGIIPDMVTLGKVIGGGMPIGALAATGVHMDRLSPEGDVYQAGTLSGNPVAVAAGLATLDYLEHNSPYEYLDHLGEVFATALRDSSVPYARARRAGSIVWLYLDDGPLPRRPEGISQRAKYRFTKMHAPLLDKGIYLPPSPLEVMFLSTAHTDADMEQAASQIAALL